MESLISMVKGMKCSGTHQTATDGKVIHGSKRSGSSAVHIITAYDVSQDKPMAQAEWQEP